MTTEAQTQTPTNGAMPQVSHVRAQFQAMLAPTSKPVSRKAWGIDVSTIWLPYFTAAKTIGAVDDVDLPDEDLGAPFRLRRDRKTNEVRFSDNGRPMFTIATKGASPNNHLNLSGCWARWCSSTPRETRGAAGSPGPVRNLRP